MLCSNKILFSKTGGTVWPVDHNLPATGPISNRTDIQKIIRKLSKVAGSMYKIVLPFYTLVTEQSDFFKKLSFIITKNLST